MNTTHLSKKGLVILLTSLVFSLSVVPALAWWSGWYDAGFSGSYSPGTGARYRHGQWDSGESEAFGSEMKWNQTRADGVRNYSNNRRWIWFCGYCYSYYTHDHRDMSNKLSAYGYSTNFWNPVADADDDDGNGRWEEIEVTAVNSSFPAVDSVFYFYSWFQRRAAGYGTLYETPQISAWCPAIGEYDTYYYDSSQSLGYYTYGPSRKETDETSPVGTTYTITLPSEPFPVHILGHEGVPIIDAALEYSLQSKEDLKAYVQYARTYPLQELRKANAERALTVVTFNRLMPEGQVDALLAAAQDSVVGIKALYIDASDPNPATRTWTVGILDLQGNPYASALQELVADLTSNGLRESGSPEFHFEGIVAVTAWLPLDTVDFLNSHESVYLADPSPSYLRLIASRTREAGQIQANLKQVELLPDGLPSFIRASFNDVYPYLQLFAGE